MLLIDKIEYVLRITSFIFFEMKEFYWEFYNFKPYTWALSERKKNFWVQSERRTKILSARLSAAHFS